MKWERGYTRVNGGTVFSESEKIEMTLRGGITDDGDGCVLSSEGREGVVWVGRGW